ncbi:urease accessory protein UreF [Falsiroseomonas sp.]|uniref:urease accessory protein UreF n=1 Tax=Falsiroseomonas sp. TaxID=2870721 RepID=UPI003F72EBAE
MAITTITATMTITTTTTDLPALARLLAWLSPAYPTGAFSYSHGLEMAVEEGAVTDRAGLVAYAQAALAHGAGAVDGALLALSWRAAAAEDAAALDGLTELAAAMRGTAELALEATQPGGAFAIATNAAWPNAAFAEFTARHPGRLTHAVVFGAAAAFHGMPLRESCFAWLTAFAANLVSAGVRVVPLGQTDGQIATAALLPALTAATEAALAVTEADDIGGAAPIIDLFSLRHETQYTRLFRS